MLGWDEKPSDKYLLARGSAPLRFDPHTRTPKKEPPLRVSLPQCPPNPRQVPSLTSCPPHTQLPLDSPSKHPPRCSTKQRSYRKPVRRNNAQHFATAAGSRRFPLRAFPPANIFALLAAALLLHGQLSLINPLSQPDCLPTPLPVCYPNVSFFAGPTAATATCLLKGRHLPASNF